MIERFIIVTIIILFLYILFGLPKKKTTTVVFLICATIILALLRSLVVWNTWTDLPGYADDYMYCAEKTFNYMCSEQWEIYQSNSDRGWVLYSWILACICNNFYFQLIITAFICVSGYTISIKKYCIPKHYFLALVLFICGPYFQSFFVLRQHLAMAIVLFSYPMIIKKKTVPAFLIISFACFMHSSALVAMPLIFLYTVKRDKTLIRILFILAIITIGSIAVLVNYVTTIFPYVEVYVNTDDVQNSNIAILLTVMLSIRIYALKGKLFTEGLTRLISLVLVFGVILGWAGVGVGNFVGRLILYFSDMMFLILPETLTHIKSDIFKGCIISLFSIIYFYMIYKTLGVYQSEPGGYLFML